MSLYKQLWVAIALLMMIAFAGSFTVSSLTVVNDVEQQLRIKNIDNANNLALAATQLADDPTMIELLISAQFDNGHYQYIRWLNPEGETRLNLHRTAGAGDVPGWFRKLIDIQAPSGVAEVQAGWMQLGSIHVQSDTAFAYAALWDNSKRLAYYFAAAVVLCGILGHIILQMITHPLGEVVKQSRAMRERRFTKVTPPRTREFRDLVVAMNALSDDIKAFFSKEASQLHQLQQEQRTDVVSGTAGREYFLKALSTALDDSTLPDSGTLTLLRIHDLQGLNRIHDRQLIDTLLARVGASLNELCELHPHWLAGRLNGSDFAVIAPGAGPSESRELHHAALSSVEELKLEALIPASFYRYQSGESAGNLLGRADVALAVAETRGSSTLEEADNRKDTIENLSPEHWRSLLQNIIDGEPLELTHTVLISLQESVQFYRPALRYTGENQIIGHRKLFTWAARLGFSSEMDRLLVENITRQADRQARSLAITLSSQSLMDSEALEQIEARLSVFDAGELHFHIPEYLAMENLQRFRTLSHQLKAKGHKIGLVNAGLQIENIAEIYDCGIDYIVLDSSIVLEIDRSKANQTVARSMATLFHSIGIKVYADGIANEAEWTELIKLGIDGGSGRYVENRQQAQS